ncbi:MAG: UDP-N-acetylmuramoyl-tripeptide--D-alanyl-D-alanine ligase [Burkholderiales bacterium]
MLDLTTAAQATGGRLIGANVVFERVTTDSRDIRAGDLFIGIRGDRFDGQLFGDQALAAGASALMVVDAESVKTPGARLVEVRDTRLALGALAAYWRRQFVIPVAAITGSNGKTTVKEMLAAILREAAGPTGVLATAGNLNNDIGMPLTLLRLRATHRYAVIEMGMNHLGEISYLSKIAAPTVALINNAGTAHIGELGSTQAIARAKGEIFERLDAAGVAVLNVDEPAAAFWRGLIGSRRTLEFGIANPAAVSARYELADSGSLITVQAPAGKFVTTLHVPGLHNVKNALAAATVALALGLPPAQIAAGLAQYRGVKGRLQTRRHRSGATIIDDTYNANPDSMKAAISVLVAYPGKKILVIGDMGELGADAESLHVMVGEFAKRSGIDVLLGLGELSAHCIRGFGTNGRHFSELNALVAALLPMLGREATVLVKGSRFMGMERVVEALGTSNGETTAKGVA